MQKKNPHVPPGKFPLQFSVFGALSDCLKMLSNFPLLGLKA